MVWSVASLIAIGFLLLCGEGLGLLGSWGFLGTGGFCCGFPEEVCIGACQAEKWLISAPTHIGINT